MVGLKLRKIGNSLGVVLPREAIARLHVRDGDKLFLLESPGGGYQLNAYDPEFETQIRLAEDGMARYRNTLRALAE